MYKILTVSILSIIVFLGSTLESNAQGKVEINKKTVVSDTLMVRGVCGSCETRIENAALIKGVKKAEWDKYKQQLIVFYKPAKVSLDEIEKEVAKAGHDTPNHKASDEVYNQLPACCAYRSKEIDIH